MLITCPKCSTKYEIPSEIKLSEGRKMQCSACQRVFEFHSKENDKISEKSSFLPPEDAVLSINTKVKRVIVKTPGTEQTISQSHAVLPEVFRPLQLQKERASIPYFWILLCFILLSGFMVMAWMYRDLLTNRAFLVPPVSVIQKVDRGVSSIPVSPSKKDVLPPVQVVPQMESISISLPEQPAVQIPQPKPSVQSVRFRKTPTGDAVLIEGILKNTTSQTLPVPEKIYAFAYDTKGKLVFEKEIYLPSGILYPDMEQPFFGTYTPVTEEIQWVDVALEK